MRDKLIKFRKKGKKIRTDILKYIKDRPYYTLAGMFLVLGLSFVINNFFMKTNEVNTKKGSPKSVYNAQSSNILTELSNTRKLYGLKKEIQNIDTANAEEAKKELERIEEQLNQIIYEN